jgi:hypothetical protein
MATTDVAPQGTGGQLGRKRIVNDMSIQVATVNGSGSQSSNTVLLRAIFQMGVPVSGKNLFPSNIAGLPTWYTIRANKDGYIGRKKEIDFLVAMNAETAQDDVMSLAAGASVLYDEPLALDKLRERFNFLLRSLTTELVAPRVPRAQTAKTGQEYGLRRRGRASLLDHRHGRRSRKRSANSSLQEVESGEFEPGGRRRPATTTPRPACRSAANTTSSA